MDVLVHVLVLVDVLVRGLQGVLGIQRYPWILVNVVVRGLQGIFGM